MTNWVKALAQDELPEGARRVVRGNEQDVLLIHHLDAAERGHGDADHHGLTRRGRVQHHAVEGHPPGPASVHRQRRVAPLRAPHEQRDLAAVLHPHGLDLDVDVDGRRRGVVVVARLEGDGRLAHAEIDGAGGDEPEGDRRHTRGPRPLRGDCRGR